MSHEPVLKTIIRKFLHSGDKKEIDTIFVDLRYWATVNMLICVCGGGGEFVVIF